MKYLNFIMIVSFISALQLSANDLEKLKTITFSETVRKNTLEENQGLIFINDGIFSCQNGLCDESNFKIKNLNPETYNKFSPTCTANTNSDYQWTKNTQQWSGGDDPNYEKETITLASSGFNTKTPGFLFTQNQSLIRNPEAPWLTEGIGVELGYNTYVNLAVERRTYDADDQMLSREIIKHPFLLSCTKYLPIDYNGTQNQFSYNDLATALGAGFGYIFED